MLEGFIEKLILAYFGDYIENLDTNKLSGGVSNFLISSLLFSLDLVR